MQICRFHSDTVLLFLKNDDFSCFFLVEFVATLATCVALCRVCFSCDVLVRHTFVFMPLFLKNLNFDLFFRSISTFLCCKVRSCCFFLDRFATFSFRNVQVCCYSTECVYSCNVLGHNLFKRKARRSISFRVWSFASALLCDPFNCARRVRAYFGV